MELSNLPENVLHIIFHNLPLKPLLRFNLVCKQWRSIISSPFFQSKYNPNNSTPKHPPNLAMVRRYPRDPNSHNPIYTVEVIKSGGSYHVKTHQHTVNADVTFKSPTMLLGSWNGLVALYTKRGKFCLYNPVTKHKKRVNVLDSNREALNLCTASNLNGLCHDPVRDVYKAVMRVLGSFCIISLNDGGCKLKTQLGFLEDLSYDSFHYRVIIKGVPYWICTRVHDPLRYCAVYFDPLLEEFREVKLPEMGLERRVFGLGDLDGQLTVAIEAADRTDRLEVWGLKEYGNGNSFWRRLFVVDDKCPMVILGWMTDTEVLIEKRGEALMRYNVRSRKWREFDRLVMVGGSLSCTIASYTPSLASPT